ncbi:helix-turn-helix domain-containing protein [Ornithinimicrobium cavernae]|uniref:AlbA family DNA-binding domain-containing protein n=1 Tax=Ornithinimicrobium cavernae TaxID=2666047 RepID=UPI000D68D239|nr:ATP-binding protein [Ornithinimicrobium cavernae]
MPDPDDIQDYVEQRLTLGHEDRSFEVKGPLNLTDKAHRAKVARAAMAMGNLRDGGFICIGIDETRMREMLPGLDDTEFEQWSDFDNVSDALARYCEPPLTFTRHPLTLSNGVKVVVLAVAEFDDVPHVCKRDSQGELHRGAVYVRPRGKPESVPVPSAADMRDLLDLAITKGVREFVRRAGQAGIPLGLAPAPEDVDQEAYRAEAARAWGEPSQVMADILAAGHTDVAVRPAAFDAGRVDPAKLERFLLDHTVRLRGWPVPFVDDGAGRHRYPGAVGQDIEPRVVPHSEAWRLCTSGQFLHRRVLVSDLRHLEQAQPTDPSSTGVVVVWDVLLYMVEVAELGARMATALEVDHVAFDVTLSGIANRELVSGDWQRELHGPYRMASNELETQLGVSTTRLVADTRTVGVELAQGLLRQFGLGVPDQVLFDWQEQVFH